MRYHFDGSCVGTYGKDVRFLSDMINDAKDITRETFRKHVVLEDLAQQERECGYESHPKRGLTMAGDWHVSYHFSHWNGKPCYFFRWSAIEFYFFTPEQSCPKTT